MPLFKERGHPWYWNKAFLLEIFCRIKPKSKSHIWAQPIKKAMLDVRLITTENDSWHDISNTIFVFFSIFTIFCCRWQIPLKIHFSLVKQKHKLVAVPKIILSQDLKTTFKQNLTCMEKTQYQFSFVHFVVDDPVLTIYGFMNVC